MLDPESSPEAESAFPFGLRLFLRSVDKERNLHFINFPSARTVFREKQEDFFIAILDEKEDHLAFVNIEAISCMIPLNAEGNIA